MLSRVPIFVSVPTLLAIPVVVVSVALSLIAYRHGRSSARELTQQNLAQIHRQIEAHLTNLLDVPARINRVNESLIRQGKLPLDDPAAWRDTLIAQLHAHEMVSSVTWGGADGSATWVARYAGDDRYTYYGTRSDAGRFIEFRVHPDGTVDDSPSSAFAFDPHVRPWYADPVATGRATWTKPYLWVGGGGARQLTLGISYGKPLYDGGKLLGVVDADVSLTDLSHDLAKLRIGKTGSVYVVDDEGLMIGSSTGAPLATRAGERLAAVDSPQPRIADTAAHRRTLGTMIKQDSFSSTTVNAGGERAFMLATDFRHGEGLAWTIVTLIPEADFLAGVRAGRRRGAYFAAGALGATLLLGVGLALLMVRPMLRVTQHARAIGSGELDREIHLNQSPELARLSQELNLMAAGLRDRMRMRESLAMAMEVQQSLLPDDAPQVQGLEVAGHSTYCDETGGDYYDFLDVAGVNDRCVAVALGDVMGHGIAAAMLMATARGILRSRSRQPRSLADLLTHMNDLLVVDTQGQRFMTMLLMLIDSQQRTLRWASAGHDVPLIYDPAIDGFHELEGGSLPLGLIEGETYAEYYFDNLAPGQIIYGATDGVWETRSPDGEQFGKDRLRQLVRKHRDQPAEAIGQRVRAALAEWSGTRAQDDDVTFVIVRVTD